MSALVVDIGRHRSRFGLAAHDLPGLVLHSCGVRKLNFIDVQ
jgi:hypothetical protein